MGLPHVDKPSDTVLLLVVKLNTDIDVVIIEVAYADAVYGILVLKYVINVKPEILASRSDNGQCDVLLLAAAVRTFDANSLCHGRHV